MPQTPPDDDFQKLIRGLEGVQQKPRKHTGRVKGTTSEAEALPEKNPDEYAAYGTLNHGGRVRIRPAEGMFFSVPYAQLGPVMHDSRNYGWIFMTGSGMSVKIYGRGMRSIADALDAENCGFIEAYEEGKYPAPTDLDAPFVERIEVKFLGDDSDDEADPAKGG
jgi:hypothetical protein